LKILALETTEAVGSVAAAVDTRVLSQLKLDPKHRTARSLAPAMDRLLQQVGWSAADVRLVAVTIGPGSFTGLRVGVTTAKTFAYAAGADILGINTLEAIAIRVPVDDRRLAVAVDAQRGQVAAAVLGRRGDGRFDWIEPMRLVDADAWLAGLPEGTMVAGPVLHKLQDRVPNSLTVVSSEFWYPTAAAVARVAARDYAAGRRDDFWELVPRYCRRSAAEEKRD